MKQSHKIEIFLKRLWHKLIGKKPSYLRVGKCLQCGRCCKRIGLLIEGKRISDISDFDLLKEQEPCYSIFEPSGVFEDGTIIFSCSKQKDNLCTIHDDRPEICRDYPDLYLMYSGVELIDDCGYVLVPPYDFDEIFRNEMKRE